MILSEETTLVVWRFMASGRGGVRLLTRGWRLGGWATVVRRSLWSASNKRCVHVSIKEPETGSKDKRGRSSNVATGRESTDRPRYGLAVPSNMTRYGLVEKWQT